MELNAGAPCIPRCVCVCADLYSLALKMVSKKNNMEINRDIDRIELCVQKNDIITNGERRKPTCYC